MTENLSAKELEELGKAELQQSQAEEMSAEQAAKKAKELAEKKARIVQVLSRGMLQEKLSAADDLGDDSVGLWVRETQEDVDRLSALGATLVTEESVDGLHGAGDGRKRVGDLVLMKIPKEEYELIQEVRAEQRLARLARGRKEYLEQFGTGKGAPVIDQSVRHS